MGTKRQPTPKKRRARTPIDLPILERPNVKAFLRLLATGLTVKEATSQARLDYVLAFDYRKRDEGFATAWLMAYEQGHDTYLAELKRRGIEGWDEPVYQGGKRVGKIRRYSDSCLIFGTKLRDARFRDNAGVSIITPPEGQAQPGDPTKLLPGQPLVAVYLGAMPQIFEAPPKPETS